MNITSPHIIVSHKPFVIISLNKYLNDKMIVLKICKYPKRNKMWEYLSLGLIAWTGRIRLAIVSHYCQWLVVLHYCQRWPSLPPLVGAIHLHPIVSHSFPKPYMAIPPWISPTPTSCVAKLEPLILPREKGIFVKYIYWDISTLYSSWNERQ